MTALPCNPRSGFLGGNWIPGSGQGRGKRTGAGRIWRDKDYVAINQRIEALNTTFPKELIKAIAWCESEWSHVDERGQPFITVNYKGRVLHNGHRAISLDWGIMQINEKLDSLDRRIWDLERIKNDPEYNLRAGVAILESKREYVRHLRKLKNWRQIEARYHLQGHDEVEITLKAYNGFQPSWAYLNRIQTALHEHPWEKAILQQLAKGAAYPDTAVMTGGSGADSSSAPLPEGIANPWPDRRPFYCLEIATND